MLLQAEPKEPSAELFVTVDLEIRLNAQILGRGRLLRHVFGNPSRHPAIRVLRSDPDELYQILQVSQDAPER